MDKVNLEKLLQNPAVAAAASLKETAWLNPGLRPFAQVREQLPVTWEQVEEAPRQGGSLNPP